MIGLYRPGTGPLHRLGAGVKLAGLFVFALAASLLPARPEILAVFGVAILAGYLVAGFGIGELWRQVLVLRWVIALLLLSQLIFIGPYAAYTHTARLVIVMLAAALLTLSTRTTELLDALVACARPLRVIGVNPERLGLALALAIRTVPVLAAQAAQLRDAQRARGGRFSIRAFVLPLLVLAMRQSDDLADALIARGAAEA